jgi:hypothetical protein
VIIPFPICKVIGHCHLDLVSIYSCILFGVVNCRACHVFATLNMVFLSRACRLDLFQVLKNSLHFLLTRLFVRLYACYDVVNPFLCLLKFMLISFFHVFLDALRGNDSQVILNDVNVLINLWNLFVFVQ